MHRVSATIPPILLVSRSAKFAFVDAHHPHEDGKGGERVKPLDWILDSTRSACLCNSVTEQTEPNKHNNP